MTRVLFALRWLLRLTTPSRTILHWPEKETHRDR